MINPQKILGPLLVALLIAPALFAQSARFAQSHNFVDSDSLHGCPNCRHNVPHLKLPGWRGQPYEEPNTGGCKCAKRLGRTYYNFSLHWPSPNSVLLDYGATGTRMAPGTSTTKPRLRDSLEVFADVRLLPDVRHDNGYSGIDCDPYGYLGSSRRRNQPLPIPSAPAESPQPGWR